MINCSGNQACVYLDIYKSTGALVCTGNYACVNMGGDIDNLDCILCSGNACTPWADPRRPIRGLTAKFDGCPACEASTGSIYQDADGNYLDDDGDGIPDCLQVVDEDELRIQTLQAELASQVEMIEFQKAQLLAAESEADASFSKWESCESEVGDLEQQINQRNQQLLTQECSDTGTTSGAGCAGNGNDGGYR